MDFKLLKCFSNINMNKGQQIITKIKIKKIERNTTVKKSKNSPLKIRLKFQNSPKGGNLILHGI